MSAGTNHPTAESLVNRSLDGLAPYFRTAVEAALAECHAEGLDAYVYESLRSNELQELYYARGRTDTNGEFPLGDTVTNARTADHSWHFFGLAIDVISKSMGWKVSDEWRRKVTAIFKKHGCRAGADWPHPDKPHYYWNRCVMTPSDYGRSIFRTEGLQALWQAVGAMPGAI